MQGNVQKVKAVKNYLRTMIKLFNNKGTALRNYAQKKLSSRINRNAHSIFQDRVFSEAVSWKNGLLQGFVLKKSIKKFRQGALTAKNKSKPPPLDFQNALEACHQQEESKNPSPFYDMVSEANSSYLVKSPNNNRFRFSIDPGNNKSPIFDPINDSNMLTNSNNIEINHELLKNMYEKVESHEKEGNPELNRENQEKEGNEKVENHEKEGKETPAEIYFSRKEEKSFSIPSSFLHSLSISEQMKKVNSSGMDMKLLSFIKDKYEEVKEKDF